MSTDLNTLDFATLTVLSKMVAAAQKDVRESTEAGEYTADRMVALNVTGSVKVGEDYEQRIVLKADPFTLFTVAMSKLNGVTVESIVREAMDMDAKAEQVKQVKDEAKAAWERINHTTVTACKGKVTVAKASNVEVADVNLTK